MFDISRFCVEISVAFGSYDGLAYNIHVFYGTESDLIRRLRAECEGSINRTSHLSFRLRYRSVSAARDILISEHGPKGDLSRVGLQKEARKRLEAGETQRSVARSYNVSQSTISRLAA
jgi:hypothetical protein